MHISVSSLSLKKYLKGKVKKKKNSVHVILMTTLSTYICSKVTTYRKANFVYFSTRPEKGQTVIITVGLHFG